VEGAKICGPPALSSGVGVGDWIGDRGALGQSWLSQIFRGLCCFEGEKTVDGARN